jgi:hypothetical protein
MKNLRTTKMIFQFFALFWPTSQFLFTQIHFVHAQEIPTECLHEFDNGPNQPCNPGLGQTKPGYSCVHVDHAPLVHQLYTSPQGQVPPVCKLMKSSCEQDNDCCSLSCKNKKCMPTFKWVSDVAINGQVICGLAKCGLLKDSEQLPQGPIQLENKNNVCKTPVIYHPVKSLKVFGQFKPSLAGTTCDYQVDNEQEKNLLLQQSRLDVFEFLTSYHDEKSVDDDLLIELKHLGIDLRERRLKINDDYIQHLKKYSKIQNEISGTQYDEDQKPAKTFCDKFGFEYGHECFIKMLKSKTLPGLWEGKKFEPVALNKNLENQNTENTQDHLENENKKLKEQLKEQYKKLNENPFLAMELKAKVHALKAQYHYGLVDIYGGSFKKNDGQVFTDQLGFAELDPKNGLYGKLLKVKEKLDAATNSSTLICYPYKTQNLPGKNLAHPLINPWMRKLLTTHGAEQLNFKPEIETFMANYKKQFGSSPEDVKKLNYKTMAKMFNAYHIGHRIFKNVQYDKWAEFELSGDDNDQHPAMMEKHRFLESDFFRFADAHQLDSPTGSNKKVCSLPGNSKEQVLQEWSEAILTSLDYHLQKGLAETKMANCLKQSALMAQNGTKATENENKSATEITLGNAPKANSYQESNPQNPDAAAVNFLPITDSLKTVGLTLMPTPINLSTSATLIDQMIGQPPLIQGLGLESVLGFKGQTALGLNPSALEVANPTSSNLTDQNDSTKFQNAELSNNLNGDQTAAYQTYLGSRSSYFGAEDSLSNPLNSSQTGLNPTDAVGVQGNKDKTLTDDKSKELLALNAGSTFSTSASPSRPIILGANRKGRSPTSFSPPPSEDEDELAPIPINTQEVLMEIEKTDFEQDPDDTIFKAISKAYFKRAYKRLFGADPENKIP